MQGTQGMKQDSRAGRLWRRIYPQWMNLCVNRDGWLRINLCTHLPMGILVIDITIRVDGFDSLLQRVSSNKGECLIARFVSTIRLVWQKGNRLLHIKLLICYKNSAVDRISRLVVCFWKSWQLTGVVGSRHHLSNDRLLIDSVRVLQREALYKSHGSGRLLTQSTVVVFWPSWYRPAF